MKKNKSKHSIVTTLMLIIALLLPAGVSPAFADTSSSVEDFGAKGDGITDDTAAFIKALKYLDSIGGGTLIIPSTSNGYLLNGGNISIPDNVALLGNRTKIIITTNPSSSRIFFALGKNNIQVKGIDFYSDSEMTGTCDIQIQDGTNGVRISDCSSTNHKYFVKSDSNKPGVLVNQNISITNINTIGTKMPFYFGNAINVSVDNCRLDRSGDNNHYNHHYYISGGTQNFNITNQIIIGGSGYAIDVKNEMGADYAPKKIRFDNITFEGCGSAIATESYADVNASNIKGNIDASLTSDSNIWFGSLNNGNMNVNTINVTGGSHLTSGLDSPDGQIIINNGVVGQLTGNIHNTGALGLLRITDIEFLDGNSTNGEVFYNRRTPITLAEFKNCKFNVKTQPTNDTFSDRVGETNYYNCIFDVQTTSPISFVHSTQNPATAGFHNCTFKGNFKGVEYGQSNGTAQYYECTNMIT